MAAGVWVPHALPQRTAEKHGRQAAGQAGGQAAEVSARVSMSTAWKLWCTRLQLLKGRGSWAMPELHCNFQGKVTRQLSCSAWAHKPHTQLTACAASSCHLNPTSSCPPGCRAQKGAQQTQDLFSKTQHSPASPAPGCLPRRSCCPPERGPTHLTCVTKTQHNTASCSPGCRPRRSCCQRGQTAA